MSHTFAWCETNQHDQCRRRYQRFYFENRKSKSFLTYLDEWVECQCPKRGCKCYVPKKDRKKTGTRRRKK